MRFVKGRPSFPFLSLFGIYIDNFQAELETAGGDLDLHNPLWCAGTCSFLRRRSGHWCPPRCAVMQAQHGAAQRKGKERKGGPYFYSH